jgi:UDP-N-acetylmuramoyl-L-alanyl-D-glutamate--2,6-diaminopimelate ligase
MGRAAAERAHLVFVTNDNPRCERPEDIAASILEGVREAGAPSIDVRGWPGATRGYAVLLDRAEAIRAAILSAKAGDLVLIAGKGHESYQILGEERRPFEDRAHAKDALAERRSGAR